MMDCPRKLKKALCLALLLLVLCPTTFATQSGTGADAHKIIIALDASKSMDFEFTKDGKRVSATDPNKLRFQAIEQFLAMLQEHGRRYYLGWVVFSTDIDAFDPLQEVRTQADKNAFMAHMKTASEGANGQYTNIPAALEKSVELLLQGDASASGSVLLLSDGNTDPVPASSAQKNNALRAARNSGFSVFSMCLNASGAAEPKELRNITNDAAPGGLFSEITNMNDLTNALLRGYYEAMAKKKVVDIANEKTANADGDLSQEFNVPGFGVRDVTVNIVGHIEELWLSDSGGKEYPHMSPQDPAWAVIHLPENAQPGRWVLHTKSEPYTKFKVKLAYDDELQVLPSVRPANASGDLLVGEDAEILVQLSDGNITADKPEQYSGFDVSLTVTDENGVPLANVPNVMQADANGRGYVANYAFTQEGEYSLSALVTIPVADAETPPTFEGKAPPVTVLLPPNSPPQVTRSVESSDSLWCFPWSSAYERQVANLAKDREDEESDLRYELVSPENAQFDSETRALRIERLWSGGPFAFSQETAIVFNVTDSEGLSCQATLTVTTRNLLTPFLIAFALVAVAAVALLIYSVLNPPYFHGEISVSSEVNGHLRTAPPIEPSSAAKGKFPLSRFQVDNIGLDYTKCFFIAQRVRKGRHPYIILKTNRKVNMRKKKNLKRVELTDGIEQRLYLGDDLTKQLKVKYTAKASQGSRRKRH